MYNSRHGYGALPTTEVPFVVYATSQAGADARGRGRVLRLAAAFASLTAVVCILAVVSQGGGGDGKSTSTDALLEAQRGQAMLDSANRLEGGRKTWLNEGGSSIEEEQSMMQGSSLVAGAYHLTVTSDGDLVLAKGAQVEWSAHTGGQGISPFRLSMKTDGNLILEDSQEPPAVLWESATSGRGSGPYRAMLLATGQLVVYGRHDAMMWVSGPAEANGGQVLPAVPAVRAGLARAAGKVVAHAKKIHSSPSMLVAQRLAREQVVLRQQALQEETATAEGSSATAEQPNATNA
eukprot:CAMPEP_0180225472 /NCGR_PEP_ID=MMETSP0987-20121128/22718_1 /TAXON_ID=697907 /ORGANISM="non described non described, Strain CCMP2293" /LENGTH=291 /DNA_ID=CAMNT_0022188541 /DNA_START=45 /DNA_END=916 /DNA_ORIENTATION=+